MLKYVAILEVDKPEYWSQWHSFPTARYYRSPIVDEKKLAEDWLKEELKKYEDVEVNTGRAGKKYFINTAIIAFDDQESENFEYFLTNYPF